MVSNNIQIENAHICFRNFAGKEGKFNPAGRRNFCVLFDAPMAKALEEEGWNIKYLQPRDPDEEPQAYLQVAVAFGHIPPKIVMVTSAGRTNLTEDSVGCLDFAELRNVDLIIRPYNYEVNGRQGVKAYVKTMYATLEEDAFEAKYVNVPDSAANSAMYHD